MKLTSTVNITHCATYDGSLTARHKTNLAQKHDEITGYSMQSVAYMQTPPLMHHTKPPIVKQMYKHAVSMNRFALCSNNDVTCSQPLLYSINIIKHMRNYHNQKTFPT